MKKGGYSVRSTLDPALQQYADEALRSGLVAYDRRHGYRGPVARLPETYGARWAAGWRKKLSAVSRPAGAGGWSPGRRPEVQAQPGGYRICRRPARRNSAGRGYLGAKARGEDARERQKKR